jgi:hypothetical protein
MKKIGLFFTLVLFIIGCGSTSSSGESKDDSLLTSNIANPITVVKDMKKDIKITSIKNGTTLKVVNKKNSDNFDVTDKYNGILTYWADYNIGTTQEVVVEASDANGWKSKPLTLVFKTVSKDNISKIDIIKTGANDAGIGVSREFKSDIDNNTVIDPFGNIWENILEGKSAESNFYIMAKNRCEILRLTNKGTNWRVPTSDELLNLIDYSKTSGSSMLSDEFNSTDITLWAESEVGKYLVVSTTNGLVYEVKSTDRYPVRCINAPKRDTIHVVSSEVGLNAITHDFSTGLKWSPMSKGLYNIDQNASTYCAQYDGGSGWRLPSINEIRSIEENGTISSNIMGNSTRIVSSTPYNNIDTNAKTANYIVVYDDNSVKLGVDYTDTLYRITCVKER